MSSDEIVSSRSHKLSSHALDLQDLGDTDLPHSDEIPESLPGGNSCIVSRTTQGRCSPSFQTSTKTGAFQDDAV